MCIYFWDTNRLLVEQRSNTISLDDVQNIYYIKPQKWLFKLYNVQKVWTVRYTLPKALLCCTVFCTADNNVK